MFIATTHHLYKPTDVQTDKCLLRCGTGHHIALWVRLWVIRPAWLQAAQGGRPMLELGLR